MAIGGRTLLRTVSLLTLLSMSSTIVIWGLR